MDKGIQDLNQREDILETVASMAGVGLKGVLTYRIPSMLRSLVMGGGRQLKTRYMSGISYYLFQPMYSTTGASICNYIMSTDKKKYAKVADRWMRGVRTDSWFLKPYSIFFKPLGNATWIFARSIVEKDGGCALELYIVGRDMYKEIAKLNMFEKKLTSDNSKISQINIICNKEGAISTSNDSMIARSISTIYMDTDDKNDLIKYIDRWKNSAELYKRSSIVFKLGILLHGEPGTGKTSLVKALATHYDASIININPNDIASSSVGEIKNIIENTTNKLKVVLLEDIDVVMNMSREDNVTRDDRTTMNGLMQLLDGTSSIDNTIFIATTNHVGKLDPAIIRAGRFDKKIEMGGISRDVASEMCEAFKVNPVSFLDGLTFPINPAALQRDLIAHVFSNTVDLEEPKASPSLVVKTKPKKLR